MEKIEITVSVRQGDCYMLQKIEVSDPTLINTPEYVYTELMIQLETMLKSLKNRT